MIDENINKEEEEYKMEKNEKESSKTNNSITVKSSINLNALKIV